MQFKKVFGFASALAILATATPAPHLAPASADTAVEEKRQLVPVAAALLIVGTEVGLLFAVGRQLGHIDITRRAAFTITYINELKAKLPDKNIVICNVNYSLSCIPEAKDTVFFKSAIGKKVSYDVLLFGKGCTFDRKGDGGYQNWAYTAPTGCQIDGGHIAC